MKFFHYFFRRSPQKTSTNSFLVNPTSAPILCLEFGDHTHNSQVILSFKDPQMKSRELIETALRNHQHVVHANLDQKNNLYDAVSVCRRVRTDYAVQVFVIGQSTDYIINLREELGSRFSVSNAEITEPEEKLIPQKIKLTEYA